MFYSIDSKIKLWDKQPKFNIKTLSFEGGKSEIIDDGITDFETLYDDKREDGWSDSKIKKYFEQEFVSTDLSDMEYLKDVLN